jgi:hypothetical protein
MCKKARRSALALVLALAIASAPGCATFTGLLTGAFTGAVDAPAQVYRENRGEFHRNPIYWPFNLVLFVPLGIAAGPLVGMGKGIALDMEWLLNRTSYSRSFGTYKEPSVWRPYTIHW